MRLNMLAGAPGFEPGNGGIKIQVVRVIYQRAFRRNAEIRPSPDQEVSGHFGMPGSAAVAVGLLVERNPVAAPGILASAHLHVVCHDRGPA